MTQTGQGVKYLFCKFHVPSFSFSRSPPVAVGCLSHTIRRGTRSSWEDTGTEERVDGQGGKLLTVTPARTFLSVAYPLNSPMFPGGSGGLLPELPGATAPCTLLFGDGPKRSRSPCPSEARDERSDSHDMREL